MTREEFSDQFDLLYDNINSNQSPGLDAYEKSVFLTKAQNEIVKSYFSPKLNKSQEGFDDSRIRIAEFANLVTIKDIIDSYDTAGYPSGQCSVDIPKDLLVRLNTTIIVNRDGIKQTLVGIPLSYNDYNRVMSKPFSRPARKQVWEITNGTTDNSSYMHLIAGINDTFDTIKIRYIRRPKPILLDNLTNGLSIEGVDTIDENEPCCELSEALQEVVLQRGVELAKAAWDELNTQLAIGNASETNLGIIPQSK